MTEPDQPCIRGCVRECRCPECGDEPRHEPTPISAEYPSLMCARCTERLADWLSTILNDTLHLDVRKPTNYGWDKPGPGGKISGSPSLVRLEVAALTDNRSNPDVGHMTQYYEENRDERATRSIPFRVCSWAQLFAEEQNLKSPYGTMQQAVDMLTSWWQIVVAQLWIDDLYNDVQDIRRLIRNANGAERPVFTGPCLDVDCGGDVYKYAAGSDGTCRECHRRYDVNELVRVEIQRQREAQRMTIHEPNALVPE